MTDRNARDAFSQCLEVVAMISVVLVMRTAIVVTVLLRNVELAGGPSEDDEPERGLLAANDAAVLRADAG